MIWAFLPDNLSSPCSQPKLKTGILPSAQPPLLFQKFFAISLLIHLFWVKVSKQWGQRILLGSCWKLEKFQTIPPRPDEWSPFFPLLQCLSAGSLAQAPLAEPHLAPDTVRSKEYKDNHGLPSWVIQCQPLVMETSLVCTFSGGGRSHSTVITGV